MPPSGHVVELLRTKKYAEQQHEEDHRLGRDQHDHAPPRGGVARG